MNGLAVFGADLNGTNAGLGGVNETLFASVLEMAKVKTFASNDNKMMAFIEIREKLAKKLYGSPVCVDIVPNALMLAPYSGTF